MKNAAGNEFVSPGSLAGRRRDLPVAWGAAVSPSLGCWLLVFIFPSSDKVFGVIWVTLNARCGF